MMFVEIGFLRQWPLLKNDERCSNLQNSEDGRESEAHAAG